MPYHKDEQQRYQGVHQSVDDAVGAYYEVMKTDGDYGHQLQHLKEDVNIAYVQINQALKVASETERAQLERYQRNLQHIVAEVNRYE